MELVYTADLKSADRKVMRVRSPHSAPYLRKGNVMGWQVEWYEEGAVGHIKSVEYLSELIEIVRLAANGHVAFSISIQKIDDEEE